MCGACDRRAVFGQEVTVAVTLRDATFRFQHFPSGQGWIPMVMELLDVKDFEIVGYVVPQVLTQFQLELKGCAVDYV